MTAPSLYQQEMAKRGLVLPKKEACPRERIVQVAVERKKGREAGRDKDATISRYKKWERMYVIEQMSTRDIAEVEGVTAYSVARGLSKIGVPRRPKGVQHTIDELRKKVAQLQRDKMILQNRLTNFRRFGREEAA